MGREIRQRYVLPVVPQFSAKSITRTKPGFFAEEEELEAAKEAKKTKADPALLGYKLATNPEEAKKDAKEERAPARH